MKAIILAAGAGTRLQPITYVTPKPLYHIPDGNGSFRAIIEFVLDNLKSKEITDIYVVIRAQDLNTQDFGGALFDKYFRETGYSRNGAKIHTISALGFETGGDLKTTCMKIGVNHKSDEDFVVCFGDNITKIDIDNMIDFHKRKNKLATVALFPVPESDAERFGIAAIDKEGNMLEFIEKPSLSKAKEIKSMSKQSSNGFLANAGYYVFNSRILDDDIFPFINEKTERVVIPKIVKDGMAAGYEFSPPYWNDIGDLKTLSEVIKNIMSSKMGIVGPPAP